ncbi:TPA: UDP-2,4-diacetamido-2,4,6-trideoxy-beta-L-altropyranose hydrolase [Citrobacter koseri]|nr:MULTISPECIES: UDP-2,4-diacetamido-2,4,6-trideoxy-beta-L-altropyranose hydrolase [Citrobacter]MDM2974577.1 UDP-2,4-diacetamido-2,4,6-trideoxy-beta-L-altropyranose hydrolase [Citrobacter sp. CK198]MEB2702523.1 UDP-2,4-diacetamido-2,4,6-trideoxy-beta-L-altropyranose hydrolase [Citrobacter koseri]MEB2708331.1 UDP-2,4-diacetamido-2,4,6-trideoxy-beta-L-altropyranose hydrolase [Citrobacter koseri]MEB2770793.1 UDP-2,4-diacetamido-2,4,6-trideoxy-beta-L-altropyranose hydrolase [Citrobacter koseri]WOJ
MAKYIAFRADGSVDTGIGHIKRCLSLAQKFMREGFQVLFISRSLTPVLEAEIKTSGADYIRIPTTSERENRYFHSAWLNGTESDDASLSREILVKYGCESNNELSLIVVDHYALGKPWETELNSLAPLLVIDDLCDRSHHCNWLIDQTIGRQKGDYLALVNSDCQLLLGPQFSLLRDEFSQWRPKSLTRRKDIQHVNNILVTLGGVDKNNKSLMTLSALEKSHYSGKITLIVGSGNPNLYSLEDAISKSLNKIRLVINSDKMSEEMTDADLCIGAAGTTSWERCALGLPTINLVIAKNQETIAKNLSQAGAAINFGLLENEDDILRLKNLIDHLISDVAILKKLSEASSQVCDGTGLHRIYSTVNEKLCLM